MTEGRKVTLKFILAFVPVLVSMLLILPPEVRIHVLHVMGLALVWGVWVFIVDWLIEKFL